MAKLTDTQLIVVSKAAVREDGAAIIPERLNKAAASKLAKSLVFSQAPARGAVEARYAGLV